jgi:hypothetical protein
MTSMEMGPESVPMMAAMMLPSAVPAIAIVVLAQKLLPPHPALELPLALAIIALGVTIAAT